MNAKRVLSVGQCFADHHAISRTLRQHYAADVSEAGTVEEALAQLRQNQFDLVLVNRVFDANGCEGVALIEQMKADAAFKNVPVMLVSNYQNSQQEALSRGAEPGFGKAALGRPEMLAAVGKFLS